MPDLKFGGGGVKCKKLYVQSTRVGFGLAMEKLRFTFALSIRINFHLQNFLHCIYYYTICSFQTDPFPKEYYIFPTFTNRERQRSNHKSCATLHFPLVLVCGSGLFDLTLQCGLLNPERWENKKVTKLAEVKSQLYFLPLKMRLKSVITSWFPNLLVLVLK